MQSDRGAAGTLPEDSSKMARLASRVRRHAYWVRHEGLARVIEEDQLDPRERLRSSLASRRWVAEHGVAPGEASAAFVVGVQRSGTNMVVRGIEADPSVEVFNENNRRAFDRFQLRSDEVTRDIVAGSRRRLVLFKSLCDSDRVAGLLDDVGSHTPARAVWVYRGVDDRVRSAVSKFGDVNRRVLIEIAEGRGSDRWQARRLSEDSWRLIREVDPASLSAESAAALFWLIRNRLFFEQGLEQRCDVHLIRYEDVVEDPHSGVSTLCDFLDLPFRDAMAAHVDARSKREKPALEIDARIRRACDELAVRLAEEAGSSRSRVASKHGP